MKPLQITLIAATTLVAIGLAAPLVIGNQVEARVKAFISDAAIAASPYKDAVKISPHRYTTGLLGGTDEFDIELGCDAATRTKLTLSNTLEYGPLPGFSSVGVSRITTRVKWDSASQAQVAATFGGKDITAVTLVGLDGRNTTTLSVPGGRTPEGSSWDALEAVVAFKPDGSQYATQITLPRATLVSDGSSSVTLTGLRLGDSRERRGGVLLPGEFKLNLKRISGGGVNLENLSMTGKDLISGDNWTSSYNIGIGNLLAGSIGMIDLTLSISAKNLKVPALETLAKNLNQVSGNICGASRGNPLAGIGTLSNWLKALAGTPELTIDTGGKILGQAFNLSATGKAQNLEAISAIDAATSAPQLLDNVSLEVTGSADRAALDTLLGSSLQSAVGFGVLQSSGSSYTVNAAVVNGVLRVNGTPIVDLKQQLRAAR